MVVSAAGAEVKTMFHQTVCHGGSVGYDLFCVFRKGRIQRLFQADCFTCDDMHERAALNTGEYSFIKFEFFIDFIAGHDHTAAGTTQCFVGGGSGYMSVRNGAHVLSAGYQTSDMSDICHQISTHFISDFTEFLEIDGSGISGSTAYDQFRTNFQCNTANFFIIDDTIIIDTIRNNVKILTGKVGFAAVGQMTAMIQIHTHNSITRL